MSSSSETSLAELPQPYDISSAVSKAFSIDPSAATAQTDCSSNSVKRMRSASYPLPASYMTNYNIHIPIPIAVHNSYVGESANDCSAAAGSYYCSSNNTYPYYNPHLESAQYNYPVHHQQSPHYTTAAAVHPVLDPQAHMDMDAWNETAAMSICNSSSTMLLDSQENIEQLDKFCKYIDSSGDDEFMAGKDGIGGEGCSSGDGGAMLNSEKSGYDCLIAGNIMLGSPPKKKRKNACGMSISDYFSDDNMDPMDPMDPTLEGVFDPPEPRNWKVELDNATMWREFDMVGTEMVITKAGRRMFPTLSVKVTGLDHRDTFSVKLDILPADHRRYKYLQSEWVAVGRSDKKQVYCEYEHPDSPNSGSYWTDKIIAFKMVKLTNNKSTKSSDQIILNSMHKYLPCMKITSLKDGYTQSFSFPETTFIAVTAYQSSGVTQLKINNNPYARAFRDSLSSSSGRKSGGHFRLNSRKRSCNSSSSNFTGDGSQSSTPSTSPRHRAKQVKPPKANCNSAASMESGFESDPGNRKDSTFFNVPQMNPFSSSSSMNCCWSDENNLWTPGALLDTTGSFCSTYLESSRVAMEYEVRDNPDAGEMLGMLPGSGADLSVEAAIHIDDDVFF